MSAASEIFALSSQELRRTFRLNAVPEELGLLTTFCGRDVSRTPGMQDARHKESSLISAYASDRSQWKRGRIKNSHSYEHRHVRTRAHTQGGREKLYCKGPLGTQISYKYTDTWTQVSLSYEHRMCSL